MRVGGRRGVGVWIQTWSTANLSCDLRSGIRSIGHLSYKTLDPEDPTDVFLRVAPNIWRRHEIPQPCSRYGISRKSIIVGKRVTVLKQWRLKVINQSTHYIPSIERIFCPRQIRKIKATAASKWRSSSERVTARGLARLRFRVATYDSSGHCRSQMTLFYSIYLVLIKRAPLRG
jgi:hypothetical protein